MTETLMSRGFESRDLRPNLDGTGKILRLQLRSSRLRMLGWFLGIVGMQLMIVYSLIAVYPDEEARTGAASVLDNAGSTTIIGPIYGDDYTWGVMTGHMTLVLLCLAVAVMSIHFVIRSTRDEEESGRADILLVSVGRQSILASSLSQAVALNAVVGAGVTISIVSLGEQDISAAGAAVLGAAVASFGILFAAVAALSAQIFETARAAADAAYLLVGIAYLIRGVTDVSGGLAGWLTPFAWAQRTYPWDENRWELLIGLLVAAAIVAAVAMLLSQRRDIGMAWWAGHSLRREAVPRSRSPLTFLARINGRHVSGWAIVLLLFGVMYGQVFEDAEGFVEEMPVLVDFLPAAAEAGGTELFASIVVALGAIVCAVPAVQVLTRFRADERAGRMAPFVVLSSRLWWYWAAAAAAALTAAAALLALGFGLGLGAALSMEEWGQVGVLTGAAIGYLPALLVTIGFGAGLLGWLPRYVGLVWLSIGFAAVVLYFGELLNWPNWLTGFSAFDHVPARPGVGGTAADSWGLLAAAMVLLVLGAVRYRRRDI